MIEWLHPAALFIGGALLLPWLRGRLRTGLLFFVPFLALAMFILMSPWGQQGTFGLMGGALVFGPVDGLSVAFAVFFLLMAAAGVLYGLEGPSVGHHAAAFLYIGGTLGVVLAGDFITWYLFWELMAVSSVFLIWLQPGRQGSSGRAGFRYLMVHLFAGMCLLGGIVLEGHGRGSWVLGPPTPGGIGGSLILIGLLFNAAIPPLHAWLADAYPEATPWGAVFLSAFTTKTAVYSLARLYAGTEVLVWLGSAAAIYGLVYAVLQNDLRRRLAYHLISHVGVMVASIGIGTPLAVNGAVAAAGVGLFANGLLFMAAGRVMMVTGHRNITEMGGVIGRMPQMPHMQWICGAYLVGALTVSAVPLLGGLAAESLIVNAAQDAHQPVVGLILTLTSAGTFLSLVLQVPALVIFGEAGQARQGKAAATIPPPPSPAWPAEWAMGLTAALCVMIGLAPGAALYAVLPYPIEHTPYTAPHLVGSLELLAATVASFFWLKGRLTIRPGITLDTDWVYRKAKRPLVAMMARLIARRARLGVEYWGDAAADRLVVGPLLALSRRCLAWDLAVIDTAVTGSARTVYGGGRLSSLFEKYVIYGIINTAAYANHVAAAGLRRVQSGLVHHYALMMALGLLFLVTAAILLGLP